MNTVGKPNFFDIDKYLDCVEGMILADEVERAFWMLSNPPAWYRDNEPERLKDIRESLHRVLFTPVEYAEADREILEPGDAWPPRGDIVDQAVEAFNKDQVCPHIMEIGGGSLWLSHGLQKRGRTFTYSSRTLGHATKAPELDGPGVFVAFELIEHLSNEMEIYQAYLKFKHRARYVFLSTPLHTYGGGMAHWRGQALGHLRAYTPKEFSASFRKLFPDYEQTHYLLGDGTQVIKGIRP